jgi:CubicO group peptidase (beta-lactamase class C family)
MLTALILAAVVDLSSELKTAAAAAHVPAMQATVINSGGLVAHGAAGADVGDAFHIGSCTKPFTATLLAMLIEQKKLRWDERVLDVFPEWKSTINPAYADVTLADVLSHESGLPDFGEEDEIARVPEVKGDTVTRRRSFAHFALMQKPVVTPRTASKYSNAGFIVAAAMAERVTGLSWESMIRSRILDPLKLRTAAFGWPEKPWGHEWNDGKLVPVDPHGPYQLPDYLRPAGDLRMSSDDLAEFLRAHLRTLRGEPTIISVATARLMHTKRLKGGLGFGITTIDDITPVSVHSGSADTFFTVLAIAPKQDLAVVVSTNAAGDEAQKAVGRMLKELLVRYTRRP